MAGQKRIQRSFLYFILLLLTLAAGVALGEQASPDLQYLLVLQGVRQSADAWLTVLLQLFTFLGDAAVPMLVAAVLFWSVDERAGVRVLMLDAVGHCLNQLIKITACVYRPWIRDARIVPASAALKTATGYSFPSGHCANAGAWTIGLSAYLKDKGVKKAVWIASTAALALLWLLVGFSRNFLGVHTPQDVGVMILLMIPLSFGCEKALRWTEKGGAREWIFSGVCALIAVALVSYACLKSYPADYDANGALLVDSALMIRDSFSTAGLMLGFAAGWFLSRRYIHFQRQGKPAVRILRSVLGCAIVLLMELFLKAPLAGLLGAQWGRFVLAALETLCVLALYPLCIRALQRRRQSAVAA